MSMLSNLAKRYSDGNLIVQIIIGLVLGAILGYVANKSGSDSIKSFALSIAVLGDLFVGALKAIAPILVFVLVTTSIVVKEFGESKGLKKVILLYIIGTLSASFIAVAASFLFPVELSLKGIEAVNKPAAQEISTVLKTLLFKLVDNPVSALANANYLGILTWSIAAGLALRNSAKEVKTIFSSFADGITKVVKFIIRLAPFGIFGLVTFSVYDTGFDALLGYAKLLAVLVGVMLVIAFIVNPIIVFFIIGKNPYPLVLTCIKESGITAFFTRSSAANIPVNLNLCKKLNLNEGLYSVSIPLGASINMAGAAVTISVLALAAVNSIESVQVSFMNAFLLSIISAVAACGASGVAGGSLMLVPLACSLFGISNDIALQVVAVGFIIGVIQDSVETALNSSSDVLFTAAASMSHKE